MIQIPKPRIKLVRRYVKVAYWCCSGSGTRRSVWGTPKEAYDAWRKAVEQKLAGQLVKTGKLGELIHFNGKESNG